LGLAERRIGIADRLAAEITDRRDPRRIVHALCDILRGVSRCENAPSLRAADEPARPIRGLAHGRPGLLRKFFAPRSRM